MADSTGAATSASLAALLPTTLGGATVQIADSAGATQTVRCSNASPTQINLLVPGGVAKGPATITIKKNSGGSVWINTSIEIGGAGSFLDELQRQGGGRDVGARIAGGQSSGRGLSSVTTDHETYVSVLSTSGQPPDQIYLSLYGTGYPGLQCAVRLYGDDWRAFVLCPAPRLNHSIRTRSGKYRPAAAHAGGQGRIDLVADGRWPHRRTRLR